MSILSFGFLMYMTIVIISNYLNHHQLPWIESLRMYEGVNVYFVSTTPVPSARIVLGYSNYDDIDFNLHYYDALQKERIRDLVIQADVVIMGGTFAEELINLRLSTKKLLLFYSERWHKRIRSYFALPLRLLNGYLYRHFMRFNNENCYMLCNGAYVANDCFFNASFKGKTFKWGYFPNEVSLDIDAVLKERSLHKKVMIIWVARFVKWKRPLLAVKAAEILLKEDYDIHLTMVGDIDKRDKSSEGVLQMVRDYIQNHNLKNEIYLTGAIPHEEVYTKMRQADIFLFTSSRFEGWGAALNEAMSNGCIPVASNLIGAAPFLIKHGENGMMFKSESLCGLVDSIKYILDHRERMPVMSRNAYQTIHHYWSPNIAARNLLRLCQSLIQGEESPIVEGPCSRAKPVSSRKLQ